MFLRNSLICLTVGSDVREQHLGLLLLCSVARTVLISLRNDDALNVASFPVLKQHVLQQVPFD